jgi:hypothetical protein
MAVSRICLRQLLVTSDDKNDSVTSTLPRCRNLGLRTQGEGSSKFPTVCVRLTETSWACYDELPNGLPKCLSTNEKLMGEW